MISIIIPTLNEEKFLPALLDSLVAQSMKGFEVIVVDGSSKDKTVQRARSYASKLPGLTVIVSKQASLPLQRNVGAKQAHGDWFIFVDADSVLMPYFIERVERYIHEMHPRLFTTWCRPDSEVQADAQFALMWNITIESMVRFKRPVSPGPLTAVDRPTFMLVGGYDEEHAFNEDIDFSLRLDNRGIRLQIIRETLYIVSLRRFRSQGTLKIVQQYFQAALPIVFFKKTLKYMPGYIMGGQLYDKKTRQIKSSVMKQFQSKLKGLMKEFLS